MKINCYINRRNSSIKDGLLLLITTTTLSIFMHSCGNPVVPTGGPKDTASPIITDIRIKKGDIDQTITIRFDENIIGKGNPVTSPKTIKQKNRVLVQRKEMEITVPNYTQHIFIKGYIVDLNENNPYMGKDISFDTNRYHFQCKVIDKTGKDKFQFFIQEDTLFHVPLFHSNTKSYQFEGLPDTQQVVHIIKNDNNNLHIDNQEEYNSFRVSKKFMYSDTCDVIVYPKIKAIDKITYDSLGRFLFTGFKPIMGRTIPGMVYMNDTGYLEVSPERITEWTEGWISNYYNGYIDSLPIQRSKKLIEYKSLERIKNLEYTYIDNKDTSRFIQVADERIGGIKDPNQMDKIFREQLPFGIFKIVNTKKSAITLGKIEIVNNDSIDKYTYIYNNRFTYLIKVSKLSKAIYILPTGKYQMLHWIPSEVAIKRETKHIFLLQLPTEGNNYNGSRFFQSDKEFVVDNNIENTLILPEKMLFNSGIRFR